MTVSFLDNIGVTRCNSCGNPAVTQTQADGSMLFPTCPCGGKNFSLVFGQQQTHDNLRDKIGQVISDKLAEMTDGGREPFDVYDSRNIDAIADEVVKALRS